MRINKASIATVKFIFTILILVLACSFSIFALPFEIFLQTDQPFEYISEFTMTAEYKTKDGYLGTGLDINGILCEDVRFKIEPLESYNRNEDKDPNDIPSFSFDEYTISVGDGKDSVMVALPDFTGELYGIGEYWYKVTELCGTSAGVNYDTHEYSLHIVVSREDPEYFDHIGVSQIVLHKTSGRKTTGFTNEYGAGSLTITREFVNDENDPQEVLPVIIAFNAPPNKTVRSVITYCENETIDANWTGSRRIVLDMYPGESVAFENIPDGVSYTVQEKDVSGDGYDIPIYEFNNFSEAGDVAYSGPAWNDNYACGTISDDYDEVVITNRCLFCDTQTEPQQVVSDVFEDSETKTSDITDDYDDTTTDAVTSVQNTVIEPDNSDNITDVTNAVPIEPDNSDNITDMTNAVPIEPDNSDNITDMTNAVPIETASDIENGTLTTNHSDNTEPYISESEPITLYDSEHTNEEALRPYGLEYTDESVEYLFESVSSSIDISDDTQSETMTVDTQDKIIKSDKALTPATIIVVFLLFFFILTGTGVVVLVALRRKRSVKEKKS